MSERIAKPFSQECMFREEFKGKISVTQKGNHIKVKILEEKTWMDYPFVKLLNRFTATLGNEVVDKQTWILPLCEICPKMCQAAKIAHRDC